MVEVLLLLLTLERLLVLLLEFVLLLLLDSETLEVLLLDELAELVDDEELLTLDVLDEELLTLDEELRLVLLLLLTLELEVELLALLLLLELDVSSHERIQNPPSMGLVLSGMALPLLNCSTTWSDVRLPRTSISRACTTGKPSGMSTTTISVSPFSVWL